MGKRASEAPIHNPDSEDQAWQLLEALSVISLMIFNVEESHPEEPIKRLVLLSPVSLQHKRF